MPTDRPDLTPSSCNGCGSVVEDTQEIVMTLPKFLAAHGDETHAAASGAEALRWLADAHARQEKNPVEQVADAIAELSPDDRAQLAVKQLEAALPALSADDRKALAEKLQPKERQPL